MEKAADRIVALLRSHHPQGLTNNEIAAQLNLQATSVRRTRQVLENNGLVIMDPARIELAFTVPNMLATDRVVQS